MGASDQIQALYTRRARVYERVFVDFLGWGRELEGFFRKTQYLNSNYRILDAGCGTGVITRILVERAREERLTELTFHAFDLTPRMLEIFQERITKEGESSIELRQADVLEIDTLPSHWRDYDLIVSSAMLEYLPKHAVGKAVTNLKGLLKCDGKLLTFVTRNNWLTRLLAGMLWRTNLYLEGEMKDLLYGAGFRETHVRSLSPWWSKSIMVIEARNPAPDPIST